MENMIVLLVLNISFFIAMSELTEVKINLKNKNVYLIFFVIFISFLLNHRFSTEVFRVLINSAIYILIALLQFKKSMKESIILGISTFILTTVAELIYACISYPVLTKLIVNKGSILLNLLNNMLIGMILVFLTRKKSIKKIYLLILENTEKITEKRIVFFSLFVVVVFNVFSILIYYLSNGMIFYNYLVLISSILTIVVGIIVFNYLKSNNKYLKVYEKYNISLKSIREYEGILEKYKINNHENKNQLLVIRNMSKNKNIIKYIDTLVDNRLRDDESLLIDVSRIPSGGLRGVIYSKILVMKNKSIEFELNIDRKMSAINLNKAEDNLIIDICKVLGVFIDNAIEAVEKLNERYIIIELYMDKKNIIFSITNNFVGYIDIGSISNPGYTTKANGRGYGLTLVEEIITKNNNMENKKEIYNDNFVQLLKIKI